MGTNEEEGGLRLGAFAEEATRKGRETRFGAVCRLSVLSRSRPHHCLAQRLANAKAHAKMRWDRERLAAANMGNLCFGLRVGIKSTKADQLHAVALVEFLGNALQQVREGGLVVCLGLAVLLGHAADELSGVDRHRTIPS